MTDLQAALGLHQLERLPAFQRRRREVADRYRAGLADVPEIELPTELPGYESALHLFVLRLVDGALTIDRKDFIDGLAKHRIGASVHFIPVHTHPYYRERYGWAPDDFPIAWREYQRMLSIPMHPGLSDGDVDDVVEAVRDLVAAHRR
jgi:dTDP-4-amino-4,6-dideoxygalactose transaminase